MMVLVKRLLELEHERLVSARAILGAPAHLVEVQL
jgi:hypothetical protein